jgi:HEAT repeat protein
MLRIIFSVSIALFVAGPLLAEKSAEQYIADLSSTDPAVQMDACRALGTAGSEAAVSPLINLLANTTDEHVAASAAAALGAIGKKEMASAALAKAAGQTETPVVQYAALLGLANIKDDAQKAATLQAISAAAESDDEFLKDLAAHLKPILEK